MSALLFLAEEDFKKCLSLNQQLRPEGYAMITTLLEGNKIFVSEQFEKEKEYYNALLKDQRPTVLLDRVF